MQDYAMVARDEQERREEANEPPPQTTVTVVKARFGVTGRGQHLSAYLTTAEGQHVKADVEGDNYDRLHDVGLDVVHGTFGIHYKLNGSEEPANHDFAVNWLVTYQDYSSYSVALVNILDNNADVTVTESELDKWFPREENTMPAKAKISDTFPVDEPAIVPPETPAAPAEKPVQDKPQPAPVALPEAPFSANFRLFSREGVDVLFTIRDSSVKEGTEKVDKVIAALTTAERGYTVTRTNGNGNGANHTPRTLTAPQQAPAKPDDKAPWLPGNGNGDSEDPNPAPIWKVAMGEPDKNGKPVYELYGYWHGERSDKPSFRIFTYGNAHLLLPSRDGLSKVGDSKGVDWSVTWKNGKENPNKPGKFYKEAVAIQDTAPAF